MSYKPWRDGRTLLLAAAAAFGAYLAWLSWPERLATWRALGVPAMDKASFGDLRVVTTAWECSRRGFDVLASNPCDPWGRAMNYPRLWLLPGALGLGEWTTEIIGIALCMAFVIAIVALAGRLGPIDTAAYLLYLASPAVLLAIERGNVDLAIFALCAGGILALNRPGLAWSIAGVALILLATMLKLYPVFILVAFVPRTRLAIGALAIAAVYGLLTLHDLSLISAHTPRPHMLAYGSGPAGSAFGVWLWIVEIGVVGAALLAATPRAVRQIVEVPVSSLRRDAFVAGSAMYMGTFLLGSNWVYRLIVVALSMPQLLDWLRAPRARFLALPVLAALLALLWLAATTTVRGPGLDAFQALSIAVFIALGGITIQVLWRQSQPLLMERLPRALMRKPGGRDDTTVDAVD